MARDLDVAALEVESFSTGGEVAADSDSSALGTSEWCDSYYDCSSACFAATNVCSPC